MRIMAQPHAALQSERLGRHGMGACGLMAYESSGHRDVPSARLSGSGVISAVRSMPAQITSGSDSRLVELLNRENPYV